MPKKRKQTVGHPIEVELTDEEFASQAFEALLAAEDRIERLYKRVDKWRALARAWREKYKALKYQHTPQFNQEEEDD